MNFEVKNDPVVESATIRCDGISVLTGPSGCGKTRVMKAVYDKFPSGYFWQVCTAWNPASQAFRDLGLHGREKTHSIDGKQKYIFDRIREFIGGYFELSIGVYNADWFVPLSGWPDRYSAYYASNGETAFGWLQAYVRTEKWFKTDEQAPLVFIDSPDAYLSSEWAAEYARVLVEIRKAFGTSFIVAVRDPNFVAALWDAALNEGIVSDVSLYEAKKNKNGKYVYRDGVEAELKFRPLFQQLYGRKKQ